MLPIYYRKLLSFDDLNGTISAEESFNNFTEEAPCGSFSIALQALNTYYIPFIVMIGFVGNTLSTVVFLTTFLKMRSSSYYLAAMSMADFGFLFVVLIVHCSYNNVFDVFNRNGWCQIFVYLSSVFSFLSVWLIIAFTGENILIY